jgi:NAD(P)H-hydrate epimerase
VPDAAQWGELRQALGRRPVVLDALLGTGVRGGAHGVLAELIELVNSSGSRVAAVDLPSGVDADSAQVRGVAVRAERTYTLCRPKIALVFAPAADLAGRFRVLPIGIPDAAVAAERVDLEWFDAAAAARLLPARAPDSHKGSFGHLLAVAGSAGKSGAAVLLARGALRSGVGLVTVATPRSARPLVAVQQAEAMTEALAETAGGALAAAAAAVVLDLAGARDALALGPGLGTDEDTRAAVQRIVAGCAKPAVVDADGLNCLAPLAGTLAAPAGAARVLTPHPGEAARLLATSVASVQADRPARARELARRACAVVVLKGRRSLVADPGGRLAVNSSGNPGLASGGTGDVLTGAVGAWLARGLCAWDAARLATYVHGVAGDLAAEDLGAEGMIASDVVERLPAALVALAAGRGA